MLNRASLPLLSGNAYSNPAFVPKLLSDIFIKSFGILFARIRGAALVMDEKNLCRRVEDALYQKAAKKTSVFPVFYDGHGQLLVRINKENVFFRNTARTERFGAPFFRLILSLNVKILFSEGCT